MMMERTMRASKVRFAVLGAGKIALRVCRGILAAENACLYAAASRDASRAAALLAQAGAAQARVFGSYEAMLADPAVECVYLCTPNFLHFEQARRCLSAGKSVVCEKPFVFSQAELAELFALAAQKGLLVMEAEKVVFLPVNEQVKAAVDAGVIGQLRHLEATFCRAERFSPDHWVNDPVSGGSFADTGCYCAAWCDFMAGAQRTQFHPVSWMADRGCDLVTAASAIYANGVTAQMKSSFWIDAPCFAVAYGTAGRIEIPNFWKSFEATVYPASAEPYRITGANASDFTPEIEHAARCIRSGFASDRMGYAQSRSILDAILAVKRGCGCEGACHQPGEMV